MSWQRWAQARYQQPVARPHATAGWLIDMLARCTPALGALGLCIVSICALAGCGGTAPPPDNAGSAAPRGRLDDRERVDAYAHELASLSDALAVTLRTPPADALPQAEETKETGPSEPEIAPAAEPIPKAAPKKAKAPEHAAPSRRGILISEREALSAAEAPGEAASASDTSGDAGTGATHTAGCDSAPQLRDRICELAERICSIAEAHSDDRDLWAKCEEGRQSCQRARTAVTEACGSSRPGFDGTRGGTRPQHESGCASPRARGVGLETVIGSWTAFEKLVRDSGLGVQVPASH